MRYESYEEGQEAIKKRNLAIISINYILAQTKKKGQKVYRDVELSTTRYIYNRIDDFTYKIQLDEILKTDNKSSTGMETRTCKLREAVTRACLLHICPADGVCGLTLRPGNEVDPAQLLDQSDEVYVPAYFGKTLFALLTHPVAAIFEKVILPFLSDAELSLLAQLSHTSPEGDIICSKVNSAVTKQYWKVRWQYQSRTNHCYRMFSIPSLTLEGYADGAEKALKRQKDILKTDKANGAPIDYVEVCDLNVPGGHELVVMKSGDYIMCLIAKTLNDPMSIYRLARPDNAFIETNRGYGMKQGSFHVEKVPSSSAVNFMKSAEHDQYCYFIMSDPFLIGYRKREPLNESSGYIEFQVSYLPDDTVTPESFRIDQNWKRVPLMNRYLDYVFMTDHIERGGVTNIPMVITVMGDGGHPDYKFINYRISFVRGKINIRRWEIPLAPHYKLYTNTQIHFQIKTKDIICIKLTCADYLPNSMLIDTDYWINLESEEYDCERYHREVEAGSVGVIDWNNVSNGVIVFNLQTTSIVPGKFTYQCCNDHAERMTSVADNGIVCGFPVDFRCFARFNPAKTALPGPVCSAVLRRMLHEEQRTTDCNVNRFRADWSGTDPILLGMNQQEKAGFAPVSGFGLHRTKVWSEDSYNFFLVVKLPCVFESSDRFGMKGHCKDPRCMLCYFSGKFRTSADRHLTLRRTIYYYKLSHECDFKMLFERGLEYIYSSFTPMWDEPTTDSDLVENRFQLNQVENLTGEVDEEGGRKHYIRLNVYA